MSDNTFNATTFKATTLKATTFNATAASPSFNLRQQIDDTAMSFRQYVVVLLCFLLNVADGFDVLAMSYASPALRTDWSVAGSGLGIIFSAALAGMTVGALLLSPLSDKFGRRWIILLSVATTGLSMLTTVFAENITQLVAIRFFTGLGIGGILASATSLASEYSSVRFRSFAVIFVTSGYSVGAVVAGPIASMVIPNEGWQQLFFYGGMFTAILFFLAFFLLPESIDYIAAGPASSEKRLAKVNQLLSKINKPPLDSLPVPQKKDIQQGNVLGLFHPDLRKTTLLLWAILFTSFWSTYFLTNWIPTLFVDNGLTTKQGIWALTMYTLGGLGGALLVGYLSTRLPLNKLIGTMLFCTALLLGSWAILQPSSLVVMNTIVCITGFAFTGGFTGMYAVVAQNYPTEIRTTGVGWGIGLGRFGAILSPMVAGALVSNGWGMYDLFLVIAMPPVLLAAALILKLPDGLQGRMMEKQFTRD